MSGPWFCYVDGHGRPKKAHYDYEAAEAEAQRLHRAHHGNRAVYIVQAVNVVPEISEDERRRQAEGLKTREPEIQYRKARRVQAPA